MRVDIESVDTHPRPELYLSVPSRQGFQQCLCFLQANHVRCLLQDDPGTLAHTTRPVEPAAVRQRLWAVRTRLVTVGNQGALASPRAKALFLTWRAPRSLWVILTIGRYSPTQGSAPYAPGREVPFWRTECAPWCRILPLFRRHDMLRACSARWLVQLPGIGSAGLPELSRLEAAITVLSTAALQTKSIER